MEPTLPDLSQLCLEVWIRTVLDHNGSGTTADGVQELLLLVCQHSLSGPKNQSRSDGRTMVWRRPRSLLLRPASQHSGNSRTRLSTIEQTASLQQ